MRDQVDQMRLEFHPDNPKIKLSILSFLLEAGMIPDYHQNESVDSFNEAVREMAANVTAGYQNYIDAGYELADEVEKDIVEGMDMLSKRGKGKHTDNNGEEGGDNNGAAGLYL